MNATLNAPTGTNTMTKLAAGTAEAPEVKFGPEVAANLVLLSFSIHRPTMRKQLKDADVLVKDDMGGEKVSVTDKKKITAPQLKLDVHKGWSKLDENARKIEKILDRYSVSDVRRGNRLVSGGAVGACLAELATARDERTQIVLQELHDKWDTEVIPGIEATHPEYKSQALAGMIAKEGLPGACEVEWQIQPLTPLNPEQLDLTKLNHSDRMKVIDQSNEMIQKAADAQVKMVVDKVAGDLVALCEDIAAGKLKTKKRKSGALTEMLEMLERVTHFSDFMTPAILAQAKAAADVVKKYNINQLNELPSVQNAIAEALLPVGNAMKKLQEDFDDSRSTRSIRV